MGPHGSIWPMWPFDIVSPNLGFVHFKACRFIGLHSLWWLQLWQPWHLALSRLPSLHPFNGNDKNSANKVFALLSFDVPIELTIQNHPKSWCVWPPGALDMSFLHPNLNSWAPSTIEPQFWEWSHTHIYIYIWIIFVCLDMWTHTQIYIPYPCPYPYP